MDIKCQLDYQELIHQAFLARQHSYSPYSGFMVGAALLAVSGKVYQGCNVENAAYSPGNCAERTAFFRAVSEGEREFRAIAIVGGPDSAKEGEMPDYCPPCGVCRQVMAEFCEAEKFLIIVAKSLTDFKTYTLSELLPMGFGPAQLSC